MVKEHLQDFGIKLRYKNRSAVCSRGTSAVDQKRKDRKCEQRVPDSVGPWAQTVT